MSGELVSSSAARPNGPDRVRVIVDGQVQGVGFRPFVYHLSTSLHLSGWVRNTEFGAAIEVQGDSGAILAFRHRFVSELPSNASIFRTEWESLRPDGATEFVILDSEPTGLNHPAIVPDVGTCTECLEEIFDPSNRRFRYPFTNCAHCGPRYSTIQRLPYDRGNTSMAGFPMCRDCQSEYETPADRRFHAQTIACRACGPHVALWERTGATVASHDDAILAAANEIRRGRIVAVKGVGGFHLLADARNCAAVKLLRTRKDRREKPFALMAPILSDIRTLCEVSGAEAQLLTSSEAPIVLLTRRASQPREAKNCTTRISPLVAPNNPSFGVMLPYSPLHHLLLAELGFPVVATSGNVVDETLCTDEFDVLKRLQMIADCFLVHNRPIVRHADDSIVRIMADQAVVLRRARGYAPRPLYFKTFFPPLISYGAQQKNTIALSRDYSIVLSTHLGDLGAARTSRIFQDTVHSYRQLLKVDPIAIGCDKHIDYLSTSAAQRQAAPAIAIQHHHAHVLSCMADNDRLEENGLGVAWDGTGLGDDGLIWGGEWFEIEGGICTRVASFRPFPLVGGDRAVMEPRRSALGLLFEYFGQAVFTDPEMTNHASLLRDPDAARFRTVFQRKINTVRTSSVGRLFDAVAAIIGLRQTAEFDGQAAMELENAAAHVDTEESYSYALRRVDSSSGPNGFHRVDCQGLLEGILQDLRNSTEVSEIAKKFHNTLVEMLISAAKKSSQMNVFLSGGCFQNKLLLERSVQRLRDEGFCPYWHRSVPPNDGGISLGQIVAVNQHLQRVELNSCV